MPKETIAYIGNFELPDKNAAAHRVLANSKIFQSLGYNVALIATSRNAKNSKQVNLQNCATYSYSYPNSSLEWFKHIIEIKKYTNILNKIENLKVLICYNFPSISLYRLKNYCKKRGIKIISDCTEWENVSSGNVLFNTIKNTDTYLRMHFVNKRLDGIIAISTYLYNYYKDTSAKVLLCPSLTDPERFKNLTKYVPSDTVNFIFAGNPGKNCIKERLDILLKAFNIVGEKHKNFRLNLYGIPTEDIEFFHSLVAKNIKHLVLIEGKISSKEALHKIAQADFSIIPRENTKKNNAGFPTKLGESLACGTPVIATDTSDIKHYICDGVDGFIVCTCTVDSLVTTLDAIMSMEVAQRIEMKHNTEGYSKLHWCNYIDSFHFFLLS